MLSSRPVSRSMRLGASARIAKPALTSARTFASSSACALATPTDSTPVRHYGGLKDQDRIFTNLFLKVCDLSASGLTLSVTAVRLRLRSLQPEADCGRCTIFCLQRLMSTARCRP